jgi:hypothetical protein
MSNDAAYEVDVLRKKLSELQPPDGLGCVSFARSGVYEIGMAFFPGGSGLPDRSRQKISTLVVGSDWGNECTFKRLLERTSHVDEKLYRGVRSMLTPAGYDLADAFYTNAWPVLREGDAPESTHHPMRDHKAFTQKCRLFFAETLNRLKPKIIITQGLAPAWFVSPFVGAHWRPSAFSSYRQMKSLDMNSEPVIDMHGAITYVAATHWSRISNCRYRDMTPDLERQLLRKARESCSVPPI